MEEFKVASGKDYQLNNVDCAPMTVWERNKLAVEFVMNMHRRGLERFPRRIDHGFSFGWTMFVLWHHRTHLVKSGIEPDGEMLLEMLYLLTDENGLPFGAVRKCTEIAEATAEVAQEEPDDISAPITDDLGVFEKDGKIYVNSRAVAAAFGKRHCDVLRDIKTLDSTEDFRERNFAFSSEVQTIPKGGEKKIPVYHLTRDGFTFLVMGYTGKKAARYKEAYINRFNEMEAELKAWTPAEPSQKSLPAAPVERTRNARPYKRFYVPEDAAEELGLRGYKVLLRRLKEMGMITKRGQIFQPVQEYVKYVRVKALGTKKGNTSTRVVVTPAGLDYLREHI
jgi:Rha family phage regulatory protein